MFPNDDFIEAFESLSSWRAWIEIALDWLVYPARGVALLMESVD